MIEKLIAFFRRLKAESLEDRTKREFEEDVAELERWIDSNE